ELAFAPLAEIEAKSVSASCNDAFGVSRIGDATEFDEHRSFLRRGGKAERRLGEIRPRHVFDQLYDSMLPFPPDLLQIWIILIEAHPQICHQRIELIAKQIDRRP